MLFPEHRMVRKEDSLDPPALNALKRVKANAPGKGRPSISGNLLNRDRTGVPGKGGWVGGERLAFGFVGHLGIRKWVMINP